MAAVMTMQEAVQRLVDLRESDMTQSTRIQSDEIKGHRFEWKGKTLRIQNVFTSGEDVHITLFSWSDEHDRWLGYTTIPMTELPDWSFERKVLSEEEEEEEYDEQHHWGEFDHLMP